jgi:hypothetical protein
VKKTKFDVPVGRWTPVEKMVSDYDALERNLRELRNILAVICMQQDDKTLQVPFEALRNLPPGAELEVSVDNLNQCFDFKVILPGEQTVLAAV